MVEDEPRDTSVSLNSGSDTFLRTLDIVPAPVSSVL